ncbi:MAG: M15 family metallopeptidase [Candidatus Hydrogenedentales bacterium]|jgi:hypothetical protein
MELPLKSGSQGLYVEQWQKFLIKHTYLSSSPSGAFDAATRDATKRFQTVCKLKSDGIAGNRTLGAAIERGLKFIDSSAAPIEEGSNWPPAPSFAPLSSITAIQSIFGKFEYELVRGPGAERESIRMLDNWERDNIVKVALPRIADVVRGPAGGSVRFHRLAAKQLHDLWGAWERAGLLNRIVSWDGSFNARYKRGSDVTKKSDKNLSNHSFGTAFDINVDANDFRVLPALLRQPGTVREMVSIANDHGFFWGGHFKTRLDGMHFEVAEIK